MGSPLGQMLWDPRFMETLEWSVILPELLREALAWVTRGWELFGRVACAGSARAGGRARTGALLLAALLFFPSAHVCFTHCLITGLSFHSFHAGSGYPVCEW